MAHRTDVFQVHQDFPTKNSAEKSSDTVVDPHCGREMTHKEVRSVLFRGDSTLYFCSRDCRERYLTTKKHGTKAA